VCVLRGGHLRASRKLTDLLLFFLFCCTSIQPTQTQLCLQLLSNHPERRRSCTGAYHPSYDHLKGTTADTDEHAFLPQLSHDVSLNSHTHKHHLWLWASIWESIAAATTSSKSSHHHHEDTQSIKHQEHEVITHAITPEINPKVPSLYPFWCPKVTRWFPEFHWIPDAGDQDPGSREMAIPAGPVPGVNESGHCYCSPIPASGMRYRHGSDCYCCCYTCCSCVILNEGSVELLMIHPPFWIQEDVKWDAMTPECTSFFLVLEYALFFSMKFILCYFIFCNRETGLCKTVIRHLIVPQIHTFKQSQSWLENKGWLSLHVYPVSHANLSCWDKLRKSNQVVERGWLPRRLCSGNSPGSMIIPQLSLQSPCVYVYAVTFFCTFESTRNRTVALVMMLCLSMYFYFQGLWSPYPKVNGLISRERREGSYQIHIQS